MSRKISWMVMSGLMALSLVMAACGPAVVEEIDSTTVIHPGYRVLVDRFGNMLLAARDRAG